MLVVSSVSPGAQPGEPHLYGPGEPLAGGQVGPDRLVLPARPDQLPLAHLHRGSGLQLLWGGGHGAEGRAQLLHHLPEMMKTVIDSETIRTQDILDSVQVPSLNGILQGPHVIVGILKVNIRSVFLHQSPDNAVVAIERGYLNGIKPILGDEVGFDILRLLLIY